MPILILMIAALLAGCATAMTGNVRLVEIGVEPEAEIINITPAPASQTQLAPAELAASSTVPPATPSSAPTNTPPVMQTPAFTAEPVQPEEPQYTLEEMDERGYVAGGTVNLRSAPGTSADILGEYSRYVKLDVVGQTGEWYAVEIGDAEGFMLKELVLLGSVPTPTPKPTPTPEPEEDEEEDEEGGDEESGDEGGQGEEEGQSGPAATPGSGNALPAGAFTAGEVYLAAQLVTKEAGSDDYDGCRAVANVIYNRVLSSKFPNTVEEVIFQGNGSQFTPARNEANLRSVTPSSTVLTAVQEVFSGNTILPPDVMFFRTASKGTSWGSRTYYAAYGGNAFFS